MANTVYTVEEIELQDGSSVVLRPANIKTLRVFMKKIDELATIENQDDYLEIVLDAAIILLKKQKPEFNDREIAEDCLDLDTIFKVIDACGGVKLNDPKMLEAAAAVAANQ